MAEIPAPKNMQELLTRIETEWSALMMLVEKLDGPQMLRLDEGGWSAKDNLAHLTEWLKILLGRHMDGHPLEEVLGFSPEGAAEWDMDVMNQIMLERNQHRSVQDVLAELKSTYAQAVKRLESTPFETLLQPRRADDPDSLLLYSVIGDTYEHFAEHRETIEKVLKG